MLGGLAEKTDENARRLSVELAGQSPYSKYEQNELIIVRIEVQDTGVGIRPKDMESGRLFSAYVQTEIGKKQGGKGTGCMSISSTVKDERDLSDRHLPQWD